MNGALESPISASESKQRERSTTLIFTILIQSAHYQTCGNVRVRVLMVNSLSQALTCLKNEGYDFKPNCN
jgi:hypothetical protein